ncbi:hypothetical protein SAVIM338S_05876 [Streptomyces avidinii]
MDLFDWELGGGRGEGDASPGGGGCSWFTVVIVGVFVLLAVLVHTFFGFLRGLL